MGDCVTGFRYREFWVFLDLTSGFGFGFWGSGFHDLGIWYLEFGFTFMCSRYSFISLYFSWTLQLRLYSKEGVREELEVAKALYIRAAVTFNAARKVVLPKLLDWYILFVVCFFPKF